MLAAYRPCRRRAARTIVSRIVRYYYCCGYLQEIYTGRTTCMSQNLQASQYSWCKHQGIMQTRCNHDVRATGRHLRLDMMMTRYAFPISHNFYRLRNIMVSIRAHPSTQKKLHHRKLLFTTLGPTLALAAFGPCRRRAAQTVVQYKHGCVDIFTPGSTR